MDVSGKRIVVTGGAGYIGGNIVKLLAESGAVVISVDRVNLASTLRYAQENHELDYADLGSAVDLESVDSIVHCAGSSLVGPSMKNPDDYYQNNVAKTLRLLDAVKACDKKPSVVFASSASVYGDPVSDPITEQDPVNPMSSYGSTKASVELMLRDYSRAYGFPHVSLRFFNVAGASLDVGQRPAATHIVARILEAVKNNKLFTVLGREYTTPDGTCIRDYVHVVDVARAVARSIVYLSSGGPSQTFNLSSGQGHSNLEVIAAAETCAGPVRYRFADTRPGDPDRLVGSNLKAGRILGWQPVDSHIDNIMASAWAWYNSKNFNDLLTSA